MTDAILTILVSMTPIAGIRAALPMAVMVLEMDYISAYIFSVIGEFLPVFVILKFLGIVSKWLSEHFTFMDKFFTVLFTTTRKGHGKRIEKYGPIALFLLCGIPVPFSGAWTTSLLVFLFGMPYWKSVIAIFLGVLLAGINIILIMKTGITVEKYYGPIGVAIFLIFIIIFYFLYRYKVNGNQKCQN